MGTPELRIGGEACFVGLLGGLEATQELGDDARLKCRFARPGSSAPRARNIAPRARAGARGSARHPRVSSVAASRGASANARSAAATAAGVSRMTTSQRASCACAAALPDLPHMLRESARALRRRVLARPRRRRVRVARARPYVTIGSQVEAVAELQTNGARSQHALEIRARVEVVDAEGSDVARIAPHGSHRIFVEQVVRVEPRRPMTVCQLRTRRNGWQNRATIRRCCAARPSYKHR